MKKQTFQLSSKKNREYSVGYALFIACAAAIGGFLFGFDTAVINGTLDALRFKLGVNDAQLGLATGIAVLGAAGGAFFAGTLANKFGRRKIMIATSVLFLISAIGCGYPYFFTTAGTAQNMIEFMVWRAIGGIGVGGASVIVPIYIAEIAPTALRGRLASMQQFAIVIGIFAALLSNYFLGKIAGGGAAVIDPVTRIASSVTQIGAFETWQWMFWVECIPAIFYGLLVLFIPESPRYLVTQKQYQRAGEVLGKILSPQIAIRKIEEIKKSLHSEIAPKFSDLLEKISGKVRLKPIVWVGIGIAALQQFVGINVIFYYGAVLWKSVGFTQQDAMVTNVITSAVNIAGTVIAILLVDKVGRKPLLKVGSIGMSITLGIMAVIFYTAGLDAHGNPAITGVVAYIAVISANIYVLFFAFSWGPVCWILLGEMFNLRIRGAAIALAGLSQWLANFVVAGTFPTLLTKIGLGGAYGIYFIFALVSIFFVWSKKIIPPTEGDLEKI